MTGNGARILIVDDDSDLVDLLSFNLGSAGYEVLCEADGIAGLERCGRDNPNLIILDLMLPGMSGFEVLRRVKAEPQSAVIPVIILTAKGSEADRVRGLELGAEDYVTKPFSVRELVLRARTLLARVARSDGPAVLRCNGISIDVTGYQVMVGERPVQLTSTEFNLLACLLQNCGRVVPRVQLLSNVWGTSYAGTARTSDTHIQRLREKLRERADCVQTIRGVGYKLEPGEPGPTCA